MVSLSPPASGAALDLRRLDPRSPEALRAVEDLASDLADRYPGTPKKNQFRSADFLVPGANFLLAFDSSSSVLGFGSTKPQDEASLQLVHLHVQALHRGRRLASQILARLESLALEGTWQRLLTIIGTRQPEAMHFLAREGFRLVPNFGRYESNRNSLCYVKSLRGTRF